MIREYAFIALILVGIISTAVDAKPRERRETGGSACLADEEYYDGHCYLIVTERNNWDSSRQKCEDLGHGFELASITTFAEHEFIRNRLKADYSTNDYWVGVQRVDGAWQLISGDLWLNTIWAADGDDEGADCARLREIDDYFMNDRSCNMKFGAICKRNSDSIPAASVKLVCGGDEHNFENYCYKVNAEPMKSFADARDQCLSDGYYLASISSQEEHAFIKNIIASRENQDVWVGASRQAAGWSWLGGDDWYDGAWATDGNLDTSTNCAVLKGNEGSDLHTEMCSTRHGYMCKRVADTLPIVNAGNCDIVLKKDTCYIVSNHMATWEDARDYCSSMGGVLANFEKEGVRTYVDSLAKEKNFDMWIGLRDICRKRHPYWTEGAKLGANKENKVYPWKENGDIDDVEGRSCVKLTASVDRYQWQYEDCQQKLHYICKIVGLDDTPVRAALEEKQSRLKADRKVHHEKIMSTIEDINAQMPAEERELMVEMDIRMKPEWIELMKKDKLSPCAAMAIGNPKGKHVHEKERERRNALPSDAYLWPNGIIHYEFDTLAQEDKEGALMAMRAIENATCIRWIQRTDQPDYVNIFRGTGCWSYLGKVGSKQDLSLGPGCLQRTGVAIHEMIHTIGFWHEHSRYDRDDYVAVNYDNVMPGMEPNFEKYQTSYMDTQGIGYDYESLMHYGMYAFAVDKSIPTIIPINPPTAYIGQRDGLSKVDIEEINKLYNCPEPVNGGFSPWSIWTACSQTCDGGTRTRSRECNNPVPSISPPGADCEGANHETSECMIVECPSGNVEYTWIGCYNDQHLPELLTTLEDTGNPYLDGHYSNRTEKAMKCAKAAHYVGHDIFAMRFGGKCYSMGVLEEDPLFYKSEGPDVECVDGFGATDSLDVYASSVTVDGSWGVWSGSGVCSASCGGGTKTRTRECNNPEPSGDGAYCVGDATEIIVCNDQHCPIHGGWSEFGEWVCTFTEPPCGDGMSERKRTCSEPIPQYGGLPCEGETYQFMECHEPCPVDGGWSDWIPSSECSVTCGNGIQTLSRECNNPVPEYGGADCMGENTMEDTCNVALCPVAVDGGWSEWLVVSECSATCGDGTQSFVRECNSPVPENGGQPCEGLGNKQDTCNVADCPVDGGWSEWLAVGECSALCGPGTIAYIRSCDNPMPTNDGLDCVGPTQKEEECLIVHCPVDGLYSEWGEWSECDKTCGSGHQTRTRSCDNPPPQYGGSDCKDQGPYLETRSCNDFYCAVDGGWGDWSEWSQCEPNCAEGYQSQSRSCGNPKPMYGGATCIGNATQSRLCDFLDMPCQEPGLEVINLPVLSHHLDTADIFYPMDNIRGSDIVGKPRDIVAMKTAELVDDARYGRSLNLNQGDWVDAGDWAGSCLSSPTICQGGFTLSFWLKIDVQQLLGRTSYLFSSGGQMWNLNSSPGLSVFIRRNGMLKVFLKYGDKEYTVDMPAEMLKKDIWHHIAVSASENDGLILYHKGQPYDWDYYGRATSGSSEDVNSAFAIGKSNDAMITNTVALLDEVAVWFHQLSDSAIYEVFRAVTADCQDCDGFASCDNEQICHCSEGFIGDGYTCHIDSDFSAMPGFVPVPKPMYFWPMDVIQSGQVQGSEPIFSEGQMLVSNGVENGAVVFNGRRDWLNVGNFPKECLSYPNACADGFAISFWLKFDGRAVETVKNFILSSGAQSPAQTGISMYAEDINYYLAVQSTEMRYEIQVPFDRLHWHHFVINWSKNDGLQLYIDGNLEAESQGDAHIAQRNNPNNFAIGKPNHANVWNGRFAMDNMAIFEQPLQENEITSVFLGGVDDVSTYQKRHARSADKLLAFNKKKLVLKRKK